MEKIKLIIYMLTALAFLIMCWQLAGVSAWEDTHTDLMGYCPPKPSGLDKKVRVSAIAFGICLISTFAFLYNSDAKLESKAQKSTEMEFNYKGGHIKIIVTPDT